MFTFAVPFIISPPRFVITHPCAWLVESAQWNNLNNINQLYMGNVYDDGPSIIHLERSDKCRGCHWQCVELWDKKECFAEASLVTVVYAVVCVFLVYRLHVCEPLGIK